MGEIQHELEVEFFLKIFNIDHLFYSIEQKDYLFLYYIHQCEKASELNGGVYLSELAEQMNLTIPEVSKAVKHLQEQGYVNWKTNEEKNKTYVEVSSHAIELIEDEKRRLKEMYRTIHEQVDQEELEQAMKTLGKITKIIETTKL